MARRHAPGRNNKCTLDWDFERERALHLELERKINTRLELLLSAGQEGRRLSPNFLIGQNPTREEEFWCGSGIWNVERGKSGMGMAETTKLDFTPRRLRPIAVAVGRPADWLSESAKKSAVWRYGHSLAPLPPRSLTH